MKVYRKYFYDRLTRIEVLFFLVYFFLFPILTDIEYNFFEKKNVSLFTGSIILRIVYGFLNLIPHWLCYRFIIQRYLILKRYWTFLLAILLFFIALNYYILFGIYWTVSRLDFLPSDIRAGADTFYHAKVFWHFSFTYIIRELLVLTALAYFIQSSRQERLMRDLKEQQLQAELIYLKAQLQPHFFFNTLNNIYSLALQQSALTAPLVARLSEMMRYVLYDSGKQQVSLKSEIHFLKNYVELESVRFSDKISISFDVQGVGNSATITPLLLLPFIENAFKHGIAEEMKGGYVDIVICLIESELVFEARNSIAPLNDRNNGANGIGLDNVSKRLEMLYPRRYQLNVKDDGLSYEVILILNLN